MLRYTGTSDLMSFAAHHQQQMQQYQQQQQQPCGQTPMLGAAGNCPYSGSYQWFGAATARAQNWSPEPRADGYAYPALTAAVTSPDTSRHSRADDIEVHATERDSGPVTRKSKKRRYVPHVERKTESVMKRNARERKRMGTMTAAYRDLQLRLPLLRHVRKRIPKEKILRIATSYIKMLRRALDESESEDGTTCGEKQEKQPTMTFLPPPDLETAFLCAPTDNTTDDGGVNDCRSEHQVAAAASYGTSSGSDFDPDSSRSTTDDNVSTVYDVTFTGSMRSDTDPNILEYSSCSDVGTVSEDEVFTGFDGLTDMESFLHGSSGDSQDFTKNSDWSHPEINIAFLEPDY